MKDIVTCLRIPGKYSCVWMYSLILFIVKLLAPKVGQVFGKLCEMFCLSSAHDLPRVSVEYSTASKLKKRYIMALKQGYKITVTMLYF